MKTKSIRLGCLLAALFALPIVARAQGSAFTYQGHLIENGAAASTTNDFTFTLYNAASGGATVGVSNVVNDLVLSNGLFTVTLDFGAAAFPGDDRWLGIAVRPGISSGSYTALTPRQPITSTPYAVRAANLTGTLPQSQLPAGVLTNNRTGVTLSGAFTGNGSALSNLNAATLGGFTSAGFWKTNGNTGANPANGAFLGSADNLPVEFKVNGVRALRLEPTANGTPNIIAGSFANSVAAGVFGATISGGGNNQANTGGAYTTIGGGQYNVLAAGGSESTIGGGYRNTIETFDSTIGGGASNTIETNSQYSTIAGGTANRILAGAALSAIGGGSGNRIESNAQNSVVPGGVLNTAGARSSFAAGFRAKSMHQGGFVWADSQDADFASTGSNQFLIRAAGGRLAMSLWHNDHGAFTLETITNLPPFQDVGVAVGDFSGYGRADLLIGGRHPTTGALVIEVWTFDATTGWKGVEAFGAPAQVGRLVAADFDRDGRLDFTTIGRNGSGFALARNVFAPSNAPPSAPTNLTATVVSNEVRFSWAPATDNTTPAAALRYAIRIGTTPGGGDLVSAPAAADGFRRLPDAPLLAGTGWSPGFRTATIKPAPSARRCAGPGRARRGSGPGP